MATAYLVTLGAMLVNSPFVLFDRSNKISKPLILMLVLAVIATCLQIALLVR